MTVKSDKPCVSLFLDSGAFSAFSKGIAIQIDEYVAFIKQNERYIGTYANLDVIGDPVKTAWNQKYMEAQGLAPLPCFHYGEDEQYLYSYIEKYNYIALGGMVPISTKNLIIWLDKIFAIIADAKGLPKVKIHGFGLTSFDLMFRYPWYSVDSTSWVMTGRFGNIFVPKYRQGKYSYLESPLKICVSNQSPDIKDAGQHFSNLAPMEQAVILDYLKSKKIKLGRSTYKVVDNKKYKLQKNERFAGQLEIDSWLFQNKQSTLQGVLIEQIIEAGVSNDYRLRDEVNIMYYLDLEKHFPPWPWPFQSHRKSQIKGFGLT